VRVLWVGTKLPWPPRDGGRLLALRTLEALAAAGHALTVVVPGDPGAPGSDVPEPLRGAVEVELVPHRPRPRLLAWLRARATGVPVTIARHRVAAVRAAVARRLLAGPPPDVVHAEQLQAWPQCAPALARGVPVVLRAQNVETDLWTALARRGGVRGRLAGAEARRLGPLEGRAVASATRAVALTRRDAARLRALAGLPADLAVVPAPFPAALPAGPPLPGRPPVVVLAGGWLPNADAAAWFAREAWPHVLRACPGAILHLVGAPAGRGWTRGPGVRVHPPPGESEAAFPVDGVVAVPVRIASGVRMKVLEAWARGVAVVATPEAAAGLDARPGKELLLATTPAEFGGAVAALARAPGPAAALAAAGRALLRRAHDPAAVARRLTSVYEEAARDRAG
jgi:hypothetical protein